MSKHIIVIGAGPGGLATAMRLASKGYAVEIYEAEDRVGGRMRGFTDGPYQFDSGPTILQLHGYMRSCLPNQVYASATTFASLA